MEAPSIRPRNLVGLDFILEVGKPWISNFGFVTLPLVIRREKHLSGRISRPMDEHFSSITVRACW